MRVTKRSARTSTLPDPAQLEQQLRLRAHALDESRGSEGGRDLDDWLQAGAEILGTNERADAA
jgi:hypothetical protein